MKRNETFNEIGRNIIAQHIPFDIIFDEAVHVFKDHCAIEISFWKPLTTDQEEILFKIIMHKVPSLINIQILEELCHYKFKVKYDEQ